jgi:hypothetical protein
MAVQIALHRPGYKQSCPETENAVSPPKQEEWPLSETEFCCISSSSSNDEKGVPHLEAPPPPARINVSKLMAFSIQVSSDCYWCTFLLSSVTWHTITLTEERPISSEALANCD